MNDAKKLALGLATLAALVSFATLAGAQQQPPPLKVTKVSDNVYWAQGGVGSNDGFIVGTTGVIVVDFLAGVSLETGNQDALLPALTRLVLGLPVHLREQLLESLQVG